MSEKTKNWKKFKEEKEALLEDEDLQDFATSEAQTENEESPLELEHPSYQELEEKLTASENESKKNWEKAVRAMAELENVERRSQREISNAHRYGLEKIISSLLPVVDSLDQALQLAKQHQDQGLHEGLVLTMKLFGDVLEKFGAHLITPEGEAFNPQQHEAMSIQPTSDVPPNTILAVFQKGCLLNDRLIRPARVIVSKKE